MKETKTSTAKKFRFWSYGGEAMNDYLQFNCGADYHCVDGLHNDKTAKQGKKTLCGKPTNKLFNMGDGTCFSLLMGVSKDKTTLIDGGQTFDSGDGTTHKITSSDHKKALGMLCPRCLSKAKKLV
jgi:hypothetical protein